MALNDVIKTARIKQNLKQEDAARFIGVTVQTYSKWENGKTEPKADQVWRLSKLLKVSTEEICRGEIYEKMDLQFFMQEVSELGRVTSEYNFNVALYNFIEDKEGFIKELNEINAPVSTK